MTQRGVQSFLPNRFITHFNFPQFGDLKAEVHSNLYQFRGDHFQNFCSREFPQLLFRFRTGFDDDHIDNGTHDQSVN